MEKRKGIVTGLTILSVLGVGMVIFGSVAKTNVYQNNSFVAAHAQNEINGWWNRIENTATGTAGFGNDGYVFNIESCTGSADGDICLATGDMTVESGNLYKVSFVLDLNTTGRIAMYNPNSHVNDYIEVDGVSGTNTISNYIYASGSTISSELHLGKVPGAFTAVVHEFKLEKLNNLVTSLTTNVNAWDGSAVEAPSVSGNSASFEVTAQRTSGGVWSTQLQTKTGLVLAEGSEYVVKYDVKVSSASAFVDEDNKKAEILYCDDGSSRDDHKIAEGQDGEWGLSFGSDSRLFTKKFDAIANSSNFYIDFRAGNIQTVPCEIQLNDIKLFKLDSAAAETKVCNLESGTSWAARWTAERANNLCLETTKGAVLQLIEDYDNLAPAQRNTIANTYDATYGEHDYSYAQSVEFFRGYWAD